MLFYQPENSFSSDHLQMDVYTDYSFPRHLHQDLEFVLMLEGSAVLTIAGREERAEANDLALILPNQIHAFRTDAHSKMLVCPFSGNYVRDFLRQLDEREGKTGVFHCPKALRGYLRSIYLTSEIPSRLSLKASLYAICDQYLKCVELVARCTQDDTLLFRMLTYVEQNYQNDISIRSMAQHLGYNESYLSRYFNAAIATSFRHYLNQYRVEHACHLLCGTDMTIAEIAMDSGFQSIRTFNRCFHTHTGIRPGEYLKTGLPKSRLSAGDQSGMIVRGDL